MLLPYIITTVEKGKIPYIYNNIGSIEEDECEKFFLENIVNFVYDRLNLYEIESVKDIDNFFDNFYYNDDFLLDNEPWSAYIYYNDNDNWKSIRPSNLDIYNKLITQKSSEPSESNEPSESSESSEKIIDI
jgi:hypothetical protein